MLCYNLQLADEFSDACAAPATSPPIPGAASSAKRQLEITFPLSFPLVCRRSLPPSKPKCTLLIGSARHSVCVKDGDGTAVHSVLLLAALLGSRSAAHSHCTMKTFSANLRFSLLTAARECTLRTAAAVLKSGDVPGTLSSSAQILLFWSSCLGPEVGTWSACGLVLRVGGERLSCELWVTRGCSSTAIWVLLALNSGCDPCSCGSGLPAWHGVVLPRAQGQQAHFSRVQWPGGFSSAHFSPSWPYWSATLAAWQWVHVGSALLCSSVGRFLFLQSCSVTLFVLQPLSSCHSSAGMLPAPAGGLQMCPTKLHLVPNYNRSGPPPGTPRAASF